MKAFGSWVPPHCPSLVSGSLMDFSIRSAYNQLVLISVYHIHEALDQIARIFSSFTANDNSFRILFISPKTFLTDAGSHY